MNGEEVERGVFINRYIESLPFVLYWEADTIAIFGTIAGLGITMAGGIWQIVCLVLAVGFVKVHTKMKETHSKGFYKHLLYRFGLRKTIKCIPSDQRVFVGA